MTNGSFKINLDPSKKKPGEMEKNVLKWVGRELFVCLKKRREKKEKSCLYKPHKMGLSLKKKKKDERNSTTPGVLYMLTEGLL